MEGLGLKETTCRNDGHCPDRMAVLFFQFIVLIFLLQAIEIVHFVRITSRNKRPYVRSLRRFWGVAATSHLPLPVALVTFSSRRHWLRRVGVLFLQWDVVTSVALFIESKMGEGFGEILLAGRMHGNKWI